MQRRETQESCSDVNGRGWRERQRHCFHCYWILTKLIFSTADLYPLSQTIAINWLGFLIGGKKEAKKDDVVLEQVMEGKSTNLPGEGGTPSSCSNAYSFSTIAHGHRNSSFIAGWAHAAVDFDGGSDSHPAWASSNGGGSAIPRLSNGQWQSLLTLLNNHSTSDKLSRKINNEWIMDSGYSHYMTCRKELQRNFQLACSYTIGLPNE